MKYVINKKIYQWRANNKEKRHKKELTKKQCMIRSGRRLFDKD
jgi:hypothetical protein